MHKLRGNETYFDGSEYRYVDDDELTHLTWKDKPCGVCKEPFTSEGHDPCLGTLPGVMNACCGHGVPNEAYVQFPDGYIIQGQEALDKILRLKND